MKIPYTKLFSSIGSACIAMLGFGAMSCDDDNSGLVMYGPFPAAYLEVSGTVTDEDGNVVEDAKVSIGDPAEDEATASSPLGNVWTSCLTNPSGQYQLGSTIAEGKTAHLRIVCYAPDDANLQPAQKDITIPPLPLYNTYATTVDFTLKKK